MLSIATPTYNQLDWLRLCILSVADQCVPFGCADSVGQYSVEHLIQDGGSAGIDTFCRRLQAFFSPCQSVEIVDQLSPNELLHIRVQENYCLRVFSEADAGMYDAINKGFAKANGQIYSWLNSDEQLLPGAVKTVGDYFLGNPEADILLGDAILLNRDHQPVCYRRIIRPNRWHTKLDHLHSLSCSMFFRKELFPSRGLETRWRIISDALLMNQFLRSRKCLVTLRKPLAAYHFTGSNLSERSRADAELRAWWAETRFPPRWTRPIVVAFHRLARLAAGSFRRRLAEIHIYTLNGGLHRQKFVKEVGGSWPTNT